MSKNQIVVVTFFGKPLYSASLRCDGVDNRYRSVLRVILRTCRPAWKVEGTITITLSAKVPLFAFIGFRVFYLAIFIVNAYTIYKTKTIELIKGKQIGDKEVRGAKYRSVLGCSGSSCGLRNMFLYKVSYLGLCDADTVGSPYNIRNLHDLRIYFR